MYSSKLITSCSRAFVILLAVFALAGCGKKGPLDGTYVSADGATYKFAADTVTITKKGSAGSSQMKYAVDGKKITYTAGKYKFDGVINDDGSVTMDQEKMVKQ